MLRKTIFPAALVLSLFSASQLVHAGTAGDYLTEYNSDQRYGFLVGSIEMAATVYRDTGHPEMADCIIDWYGTYPDKAHAEIRATFANYKTYPAAAIIKVLMQRHCPAKTAAE